MTSSRDIEREAEESRAQLSSTLEQLRDRLTPGQIVDDMLTGSGAGARAFVGNLGTTVRDNPLPSLLIGAGILMMMTGSPTLGLGGSSSRMRSYADDGRDESRWRGGDVWDSEEGEGITDKVGDMAARAGDSVSSAASSAMSGLRDAAESVRDTASSMADSVTGAFRSTTDSASHLGENAGRWTDNARHMASDMGDQVSDTMRTATGRTMDMGRQAQDRMGRMMEEQPLLMGAIGLFVGAALGALLPSTRVENRLMGDTADRVKDTATGLAAEQFEHAQEVAGEVLDRVKDEAASQGLTLDAAKEKAKAAASDIGEKVQAVAGKAAEAAGGAATDGAGRQGTGGQGASGQQGMSGQGGQAGAGRQGEAGARSPTDPVVTRTAGGSALGGEAGAASPSPSPAPTRPGVVPPPAGASSPSGGATAAGKPKGSGSLL
ncbi:DUF3618 domain-containing protein [uncultured Alsobacter sp.]|uniref:DUF3618 domain-containing protein n=1 Tax=uncultured Alsobacter sp. TaxID=1748258 RepID=UPI0025ECEF97|nr:DUF3618 domain-containing protein [uncultured Alsobacter sp.]